MIFHIFFSNSSCRYPVNHIEIRNKNKKINMLFVYCRPAGANIPSSNLAPCGIRPGLFLRPSLELPRRFPVSWHNYPSSAMKPRHVPTLKTMNGSIFHRPGRAGANPDGGRSSKRWYGRKHVYASLLPVVLCNT